MTTAKTLDRPLANEPGLHAAITPSVLLVDDDDDFRSTMRELMPLACGCDCIAIGSHDEMVELGDRALACKLAILDINLGPGRPSGVDAYEWLKAHRFKGRVVFLTGHARSYPLVAQALRLGTATLYQKPITVEQLCLLVGETTNERAG